MVLGLEIKDGGKNLKGIKRTCVIRGPISLEVRADPGNAVG